MRVLTTSLAFLLVLVGAAELRADDGVPGLRWQAPPSCPDESAIAARLARRAPAGATIDAGVRIESLADGSLRAEVELPGGEHRELRGVDCEALSDAALVVLSLSLGWTANEGEQPATTDASPEPPASVTAEQSAPAARRRPPGLSIFVGGDAMRGLLPETALAAIAGASVETLRWRARLGGRWLRGEVSEAAEPEERGGRFDLAVAELDLCRRVVAPLWACVGGSAGRLRASGFGVREPRSPSSLWLSVGAGLELRAPLGRDVELVLGARASAPLRRHRYGFEGADPLHRAAPVTGRIVVGISWSFFAPDSPTRTTQPAEEAHARSVL